MKLIDYKTPGVRPVGEESFAGRLIVLRPFGVPRLQLRKLQIVRATGGSGCEPLKMGNGVFVSPQWEELPVGSGKIVKANKHAEGWKSSRGQVIGLCSPELLREVASDPDTTEPGDPDALSVMVAVEGRWGQGKTVAEALKACGRKALRKDDAVWVVHEEAYINDMGFVCTPNEFVREGRPTCQMVSGDHGLYRTLAAAEEYAAQLIAAARAHA